MSYEESTLTLHDLQPSAESYLDEVIDGLSQSSKSLPCKLFYDERGYQLFEEICRLDEYYLTRTEVSIMDDFAGEMAERIEQGAVLIELGSGASVKTRFLLDHLRSPAAYVPVDISRDHLEQTAAALNEDYPNLNVVALCADFTSHMELPEGLDADARRVVYFPGSTIGNFQPHEVLELLRNIRGLCGESGGMLIGIDRKKDVATLEAAYDDAAGVTAQFNLNILTRINRELGADFDEDQFEHRAIYNAEHGRVEISLVSRQSQIVHIDDQRFSFRAGEPIRTEYSYKFSVEGFEKLAESAGFERTDCWTDDENMFSVLFLEAA